MTIADKVVDIQQLLSEISMAYETEINEYVQEINYLNRICNEQTMEVQYLNNMLNKKDEEIKRLRG